MDSAYPVQVSKFTRCFELILICFPESTATEPSSEQCDPIEGFSRAHESLRSEHRNPQLRGDCQKISLQKDSELMTNVLQALIQGLAFVKSLLHKNALMKALTERLKIGDPALAEQGYRYLQRDLNDTLYL